VLLSHEQQANGPAVTQISTLASPAIFIPWVPLRLPPTMRIHAGLVLTWVAGAVRAGNIQLPGLTLPSSAASNAALVKSTFLTAYTDYKTYVQYSSPHLTDSCLKLRLGAR
jgi:hypothetical protein